jgi:hypothetical protein
LSGLPPLEMGAGMGEGECAGDATRGFDAWGFRFCPCGCGTAFEGAGEPAMEPKVRFEGARELGTGPPLGM